MEQILSRFLEEVREVVKWAVDTAKQYLEALKAIEKCEKERSKWRRMAPPIIHPLLLDKRSKIHRCRNAI